MTACDAVRRDLLAAGSGDPQHQEHVVRCTACSRLATSLAALDRALAPVEDAGSAEAPAFETVRAAARGAARRRRITGSLRRQWPVVLASIGAAAGVLAVVSHFRSDRTPAHPAVAVVGEVIDSSGGSRTVLLGDGARVTVASGRAWVGPSEGPRARVHLDSGLVWLDVPALGGGASLSVETPDAEVRVHGTRFSVARDGHSTSVAVAEGTVEVRPSGLGRLPVLLHPGESSSVEPLESFRKRCQASAVAALERGHLDAAGRWLDELLATAPEGELAGEAQALLAWKMSAQGDRSAAIERYRASLAALPLKAQPLWADNACAQLALLAEQEDRRSAVAAWRDYLSRFPAGAHAVLARNRLMAWRRAR